MYDDNGNIILEKTIIKNGNKNTERTVIADDNFEPLLEYQYIEMESGLKLIYYGNNVYSLETQDEITHFYFSDGNFMPRETRLFFTLDPFFSFPFVAHQYSGSMVRLMAMNKQE